MENSEYGILYQVVKVSKDLYILVPQEMIEGVCFGDEFLSEDKYPLANREALENSTYVVDSVMTLEDLLARYDYPELEDSFLVDYYNAEMLDGVLLVEFDEDMTIKKEIPKSVLKSDDFVYSLQSLKNEPAIYLNEAELANVIKLKDVGAMRERLLTMKKHLESFKSGYADKGVSKLIFKNGKLDELYSDGSINVIPDRKKFADTGASVAHGDFSTLGLERFIKERVIGHDKEIRRISTIVSRSLNPRAQKQHIGSILLSGPTGVGKTETFRAIGDYYGLPFREINTPNLVPSGIVGTNINDIILSIIDEYDGDLEAAKRAILYFDEFDKISKHGVDVKAQVVSELYKVMEGARIGIKTGVFSGGSMCYYDTAYPLKVYSGVFEEASIQKKHIGFSNGQATEENSGFDLNVLFQNSLFNKEMFDRIMYKFHYDNLSIDEIRKVLTDCKTSVLRTQTEMFKLIYNVSLVYGEDFVEALLDVCLKDGKSIRSMNNMISEILLYAEDEVSRSEGQYQRLVLTPDAISDSSKIQLY